MTQPVASYRSDWLRDLDGPPPPPSPPALPPLRDPLALPDAGGGAAGKGSIRLPPLVVSGLDGAQVPVSVITARLDAFIVRATPTFRTAEGWATVTIPFWMSTFGNISSADEAALAGVAARAGLNAYQVGLLHAGRATPEVIESVTQGLIDAGYVPARTFTGSDRMPDRVRQTMMRFGIGLDCAGYVAPAGLVARGIARGPSGFSAAEYEDLSNLTGKGYAKVTVLADLRPGDVFALAPNGDGDIGHRAIVRDARSATPSEIQELGRQWPLPESATRSAQWQKIVVDSSWGSFGNPLAGGVDRRVWWHEATTDVWAWTDRAKNVVTAGPYGHLHYAAYTPRSAR
jgi:hypothetical protein